VARIGEVAPHRPINAELASGCVETQRREARNVILRDESSDAVSHELHMPVQEENQAAVAALEAGE
jgi:hypothetical protein